MYKNNALQSQTNSQAINNSNIKIELQHYMNVIESLRKKMKEKASAMKIYLAKSETAFFVAYYTVYIASHKHKIQQENKNSYSFLFMKCS